MDPIIKSLRSEQNRSHFVNIFKYSKEFIIVIIIIIIIIIYFM